jgi:hypothetical protein
LLEQIENATEPVTVMRVDDAEIDKMWSFVESKQQQRWLWSTITKTKALRIGGGLLYRKRRAIVINWNTDGIAIPFVNTHIGMRQVAPANIRLVVSGFG